MSFVNFAKKEISFKVVYYGPALCGKTASLEYIHESIPDDVKGQITMLSTQQDRTLYFDFLPLKSDLIKGFVSKFQLYTVPGQPIYNATRRLVLNGVDGIVFVADSQWAEMGHNVESFANLEENLAALKNSIDKVMYILQFNKRDLPNIAPAHYMDFMLNRREPKVWSGESVAKTGIGVYEALNVICKLVIKRFIADNHLPDIEVPEQMGVASGGGK